MIRKPMKLLSLLLSVSLSMGMCSFPVLAQEAEVAAAETAEAGETVSPDIEAKAKKSSWRLPWRMKSL